MMTIITKCPFCGAYSEVEVDFDAFTAWKCEDKNIQDVMPDMPASKREMLISGICEDCQRKIFE